MKKKATMWTLTLLMTMMTTTPALALEYNVSEQGGRRVWEKAQALENRNGCGRRKAIQC